MAKVKWLGGGGEGGVRLWSVGPDDVDDDSNVDFHGIDYAVKKTTENVACLRLSVAPLLIADN